MKLIFELVFFCHIMFFIWFIGLCRLSSALQAVEVSFKTFLHHRSARSQTNSSRKVHQTCAEVMYYPTFDLQGSEHQRYGYTYPKK